MGALSSEKIMQNIHIFDTRFVVGGDYKKRWGSLQSIAIELSPDVIIIDTLLSVSLWVIGMLPDNSEPSLWQRITHQLGN